MTISELQKYLSDFHPKTEVEVVVNNYPAPFELLYGGDEGCTKETADRMVFSVGGTHENVSHRGDE